MTAQHQSDQSMRDAFRGYYRPSQARTKTIWKSALVVFDTNVLLDLYRYSAGTRQALMNVMSRLQEQLWLPHQVAREFQERRLGVVRQQDDVAQKLKDAVAQAHKSLRNRCNDVAEHPYLEQQSLLAAMDKGFNLMLSELSKGGVKPTSWDPIEDDEIRKRIDELFAGRVGPAFAPEELKLTIEEGEKRFAAEIPPGFRDADKEGDRKYGDLILWLQIVAKAKIVDKPVVLVTNDGKEDWWWMHGSNRVGPHPKLVEELYEKAGTDLLMYTPDRFTAQASRILKTDVSKETLDEIATVADRPEDRSVLTWREHVFPVEALLEAAEHQLIRLRQKRNGHISYHAGLKNRLMESLSEDELNEIHVSLHDQERRIQTLSDELAELEDALSTLRAADSHSARGRRVQALAWERLVAMLGTPLRERFATSNSSRLTRGRALSKAGLDVIDAS